MITDILYYMILKHNVVLDIFCNNTDNFLRHTSAEDILSYAVLKYDSEKIGSHDITNIHEAFYDVKYFIKKWAKQ
jgi:hypothetical protein